MGFGLHALATAHTFASENVLGVFLVQVVKLGFFTSLVNIPCFWMNSYKKRLFLPLSWYTAWVSYSRFVLSFFSSLPPGPGMFALGGFYFVAVGWMILLTLGGRGIFAWPHAISLFTIWQLRIADSGIPKRVSVQWSLVTWDTNFWMRGGRSFSILFVISDRRSSLNFTKVYHARI